ncbi:histidine phosphatase family protein [Gordonia neofelifaecis]|uniref:Phosphoglycerate mutase n=1 Tax=Gordonia neofelifaecis NRRL B-59395 TaxID=644548 RepID=F1YG14_9ACTN|nr:phosphoglycerate mutase [Gordonia neofelifaecis NRRL B-59395]
MVAARTAPNRSVRFGGEHDGLDDRGRRDAAELASAIGAGHRRAVVGPETSVIETARSARVSYTVDSGLASLDVGQWCGRSPEQIDPDDLGRWFTDPAWTGHGGESVDAFVARIRTAVRRRACASPMIVVAGPVAQALLCDGSAAFFTVAVRPASTHIVTI